MLQASPDSTLAQNTPVGRGSAPLSQDTASLGGDYSLTARHSFHLTR